MTKEESCALYILLFEELSMERIDGIEDFVSVDIQFKDPFNELSGLDAFRRLLVKTLNDVKDPKFQVTHRAWTDDVLFLRWSFQGEAKGLNHWAVQGMSEIRFDERGLVCQHIDHWDASKQFYAKLPIIGTIIRLIRRRLQVS
jgi:steroid delta-isomerase